MLSYFLLIHIKGIIKSFTFIYPFWDSIDLIFKHRVLSSQSVFILHLNPNFNKMLSGTFISHRSLKDLGKGHCALHCGLSSHSVFFFNSLYLNILFYSRVNKLFSFKRFWWRPFFTHWAINLQLPSEQYGVSKTSLRHP